MEHFLASDGVVTFLPGIRREAGVCSASEEPALPLSPQFDLLGPLHVRLEAGQLLYRLITVRPVPGEAGLALLISSSMLSFRTQTSNLPPASIINVWISVTFSTKISRRVTVNVNKSGYVTF